MSSCLDLWLIVLKLQQWLIWKLVQIIWQVKYHVSGRLERNRFAVCELVWAHCGTPGPLPPPLTQGPHPDLLPPIREPPVAHTHICRHRRRPGVIMRPLRLYEACLFQVRAVGGLLKFLDKKRIGIELEESSCRVPVLSLNIFTLWDKSASFQNIKSASAKSLLSNWFES